MEDVGRKAKSWAYDQRVVDVPWRKLAGGVMLWLSLYI